MIVFHTNDIGFAYIISYGEHFFFFDKKLKSVLVKKMKKQIVDQQSTQKTKNKDYHYLRYTKVYQNTRIDNDDSPTKNWSWLERSWH